MIPDHHVCCRTLIASVDLESSLHESSQKIAPSELTFEQELGAGEFGRVFRGSYRGREVAIKKLNYDSEEYRAVRDVMGAIQHC